MENRLKRMERILGGLADDDDDDYDEEQVQEKGASDDNNYKHGKRENNTTNESTKKGNNTSTTPGTSAEPKNQPQHVNNNKNTNDTTETMTTTLTDKLATDTTTTNKEKDSKEDDSSTSSNKNNKNNSWKHDPSGLSSLNSTGITRYVGDMSPLPFLAQKINFEDARVASTIGFKVRKFGHSLLLYKEDDEERAQGASERMLRAAGRLKPGQTINTMNDWIYAVAGIDRVTSDRLMRV